MCRTSLSLTCNARNFVRRSAVVLSNASWHDRDQGGMILARAAGTEGGQHIAETAVPPDGMDIFDIRLAR